METRKKKTTVFKVFSTTSHWWKTDQKKKLFAQTGSIVAILHVNINASPVITFWVKVPVLSEQIQVVEPNVSTPSRFFTSTIFAAICQKQTVLAVGEEGRGGGKRIPITKGYQSQKETRGGSAQIEEPFSLFYIFIFLTLFYSLFFCFFLLFFFIWGV